MNLVRSPSSWPHLVMEGGSSGEESPGIRNTVPFPPPCNVRLLFGIRANPAFFIESLFVALSNAQCPNISNLSPRHPLKTLANVGSPSSPVAAGVPSVRSSSPRCSAIVGEVVFFDDPSVCLYVKFNDPPLPGSLKVPRKNGHLQTEPHTIYMRMHAGDRTHHSHQVADLCERARVWKSTYVMKYTQKLYFYIADLFYYVGLIFLWKSS